jgi:hypothetical protein
MSTKDKFKAKIEIIGINPYVFVPEEILLTIFTTSGKFKGHIPIRGEVNGKEYKQTLVKFKSEWRLYINTTMLENSPKRIGEIIHVSAEFDPSDRSIEPHPKLVEALKLDATAQSVFDNLSSSKKHEIVRYISALKTEDSIARNINRAIDFLHGKGRFIGRDKP